MRHLSSILAVATALGMAVPATSDASTPNTPTLERVTTIAPYPRGLAMVADELYVLCRGRVRGAGGGVSASVDDQAGSIYVVDPNVTEPVNEPVIGGAEVSSRVRTNGRVFARPTSPPFRLWDRTSTPPESDGNTDRPYCTLRFHEATDSFYVCAFSGIDKTLTAEDQVAFSKNASDALLRYDRRDGRWHEVDRRATGEWPARNVLDGPDNCLPLGANLWVVTKENSLLLRYDLTAIVARPDAGMLRPAVVYDLGEDGPFLGPSALAARDGWLYVGTRTGSIVYRLPLDEHFSVPNSKEIGPEIVAMFDPWDPATGHSANITDMDFDDEGRLYVVSASPARVYRFRPDPDRPYDARNQAAAPWLDLDARTRTEGAEEPVKSENVLFHDGWLYVTTGNGYAYQAGAHGTVYRVRIDD